MAKTKKTKEVSKETNNINLSKNNLMDAIKSADNYIKNEYTNEELHEMIQNLHLIIKEKEQKAKELHDFIKGARFMNQYEINRFVVETLQKITEYEQGNTGSKKESSKD